VRSLSTELSTDNGLDDYKFAVVTALFYKFYMNAISNTVNNSIVCSISQEAPLHDPL